MKYREEIEEVEYEIKKYLKYLTHFKFPKIFLMVVMIILAYYLFKNPLVVSNLSSLGNLSYFGIFIAGMLFSFGFSTPFAVGFFIVANPENIFTAALIAGAGAFLSDFAIFKTIRLSFLDEFNEIKKIKIIKLTNSAIKKSFSKKLINYTLFILAGVVIASPLPDEVGVALLAGISEIKTSIFSLFSFVLNTLGILFILYFF